jgi:hypothetical protein
MVNPMKNRSSLSIANPPQRAAPGKSHAAGTVAQGGMPVDNVNIAAPRHVGKKMQLRQ